MPSRHGPISDDRRPRWVRVRKGGADISSDPNKRDQHFSVWMKNKIWTKSGSIYIKTVFWILPTLTSCISLQALDHSSGPQHIQCGSNSSCWSNFQRCFLSRKEGSPNLENEVQLPFVFVNTVLTCLKEQALRSFLQNSYHTHTCSLFLNAPFPGSMCL